jgi:hypothetical protein
MQMMSVVGTDFSRVACAGNFLIIIHESESAELGDQVWLFVGKADAFTQIRHHYCAKQGACRMIQEFKGAALAQQARRRARFLSATLLWIGKHGHGDLVCRRQYFDCVLICFESPLCL